MSDSACKSESAPIKCYFGLGFECVPKAEIFSLCRDPKAEIFRSEGVPRSLKKIIFRRRNIIILPHVP